MGRYLRMIWTEIAHRRGDSATADTAGCRVRRYRRGGERQLDGAPGVLPLHVRFRGRQRNHTARSHRRGDGQSTICGMRATLRPNTRAVMQASKGEAGKHEQTRENRRSQLSDLAAEARANRDATTLERLIVKGLTRYYHGIDDEARRALAETEPPLTGTVWDAVIAATVEHACTTHGAEVPAWTQAPERFLKRPWVYRRGLIERGTALADAPAAFIRHNTFIEPRNLDERGGERHVWADHESAAPRVVRPAEREAEAG